MNRIELLKTLQTLWPDARMILPGGTGNVLFVDENYHVPDESEIDGLIHWRKWYQVFTLPQYVKDVCDCDDYALTCYRDVRGAFKGGVLAFGLCTMPTHAVNFMVTSQGIWLYDYYRDRLWKATTEPVYFWLI